MRDRDREKKTEERERQTDRLCKRQRKRQTEAERERERKRDRERDFRRGHVNKAGFTLKIKINEETLKEQINIILSLLFYSSS